MKVTCTRRIQFCAGHRVMGHENKCRNLHGHNYVVLVEAEAPLDAIGRVIDFSVLKDRIGGWIDRWWDHGFLLAEADDEVRDAVKAVPLTKVFALPENPTAENMARFLLNVVAPAELLGTGVTVTSVVVWETENCYAEARL